MKPESHSKENKRFIKRIEGKKEMADMKKSSKNFFKRIGGQNSPPPKNLSHISYNDEIWHRYTVPNEDSKYI